MQQKYEKMINDSGSRMIKIHGENDVFTLERFIDVYIKTYQIEIDWGVLQEQIQSLKDLLQKDFNEAFEEIKESQTTLNALKKVYDRALNSIHEKYDPNTYPEIERTNLKIRMENELRELNEAYAIAQINIEHKLQINECFTGPLLMSFQSYKAEKEKLLKQLEKKICDLRTIDAKFDKPISQETEQTKVLFETKRRVSKFFTVSLLRAYIPVLEAQGIKKEETLVTVLGRYHGQNLPFSSLGCISRMQVLYISGGPFTVLLDLASAYGTKGKFKYPDPLTPEQIERARCEAKISWETTEEAATTTSRSSTQRVAKLMGESTATKTCFISEMIMKSLLCQSTEEFDFSSDTPNGTLGIATIPKDSIVCLNMGIHSGAFQSAKIQIAFQGGQILEVLALSQSEYESCTVRVGNIGILKHSAHQQGASNVKANTPPVSYFTSVGADRTAISPNFFTRTTNPQTPAEQPLNLEVQRIEPKFSS